MENHIIEYTNTLKEILNKYNQNTEVEVKICKSQRSNDIMRDRYLEFNFNIVEFNENLADEILDFTFDCLINDGIEIIPSDKMIEFLSKNHYKTIF